MERETTAIGQRLPAPLSRLWEWVALSADRRVLTAGILVVAFATAGLVGDVLVEPASSSLASENTAIPLVSTLLSGTFLVFSIVVSVSTLVVSQQQDPLAQQFGRIQSVVTFRRQLEEVTGVEHAPAQPEPLLRLLSGHILDHAQYVSEEVHTADLDLRRDLDAYVRSLAEETGAMNERLGETDSSLDIVLATMNYNHDRQINDLRRLRTEHGDELDDSVGEAIEEMLRQLQYFATAREYFKTLYTRREFARLSRDLTLTTLPVVAIVATFLHFLADIPDIDIITTATVAIAFAPFILVATYILRVAVISMHTRAAGQFATGGHAGDIDGIPRKD